MIDNAPSPFIIFTSSFQCIPETISSLVFSALLGIPKISNCSEILLIPIASIILPLASHIRLSQYSRSLIFDIFDVIIRLI